jgi:hypothetical protein
MSYYPECLTVSRSNAMPKHTEHVLLENIFSRFLVFVAD